MNYELLIQEIGENVVKKKEQRVKWIGYREQDQEQQEFQYQIGIREEKEEDEDLYRNGYRKWKKNGKKCRSKENQEKTKVIATWYENSKPNYKKSFKSKILGKKSKLNIQV